VSSLYPLRGVRFNLAHVRLAGVLAPPYDVISPMQREELYGRDLRNIVRIDYGKELGDDVPGESDRYSRAREHVHSWQRLGILQRDPRPALYVYEHEFITQDLLPRRRRGLFARVPALPWEESEVRPHERTLRAPKEDRLALLRATQMQTSAVFCLWDGAPGAADALAAATSGEPDMAGHHRGEVGIEEHRLWVVDEAETMGSILEALRPARLYIADGHHRFETAAAYAAERRAAEPDAPADADFGFVLVYLCATDDEGVEVLPIHRLVQPDAAPVTTVEELRSRLDSGFAIERRPDLATAAADAGALRATHHAFSVAARDGTVLLRLRRTAEGSPRARLDVTVLEERILRHALGIGSDRVAEGALSYTRSLDEADAAVTSGDAALALCLNGCTPAEIIAVSDAGETMPQKSTYFYPKVPTGLVLSPV